MSQLNDQSDGNDSSIQLRELLNQQWQEHVNSDKSDFDLDLLAACAEGRLLPHEEAEAQAMMAASPVAFETFLFMRDEFNRNEKASSATPANATTVPPALATANEAKRQHPEKRWSSASIMTTVASLAVAVLVTTWGLTERTAKSQLGTEIALLKERLNQVADQEQSLLNQNLLAQKELSVTLAAQRQSVYLAGMLSPTMLKTATLTLASSRDVNEETQEEKDLRLGVGQRLRDTVQNWSSQEADDEDRLQLLETAMQQLLSDDQASADQTLALMKTRFPDQPDVRNLEAVILLTRAESALVADATRLQAQAETILREVTMNHRDYAAAWLNLALLTERTSDFNSARPLWNRFVAAERNPELRSVIEKRLAGN